MTRCSVCARFARFMETDELAAPQRSAHVHPDAVSVHIPSSLSADEPLAFRERKHDGDTIAMAAAAGPSPGYYCHWPFQLPSARPVSISLPASPTAFDISRAEAELQRRHAMMATDAAPLPPPRAPAAAAMAQPDRVVFRSQPIPAAAAEEEDKSTLAHDEAGAGRCKQQARSRDTSYDSFKTWSGKLEKQIAAHLLGGRPPVPPKQPSAEEEEEAGEDGRRNSSSMPRVQRFVAALEGPECWYCAQEATIRGPDMIREGLEP